MVEINDNPYNTQSNKLKLVVLNIKVICFKLIILNQIIYLKTRLIP